MKKILYLFIAVILLGAIDVTAQIKISEGFESVTFPPTGWTTKNLAGAKVWARNTATKRTGLASAFNDYETSGSNDWLVTKQFTVGANDTLSFWILRQFNTAYPPDNLDIKVSTTDTAVASFSTNLATINIATSSYTVWTNYKYYLGGTYNGQSIYVAFRHYDTDGNGMFLDDVAVGNAVLNDVGVSAYVSPTGPFCSGSTISPVVSVKNFGLTPQTVIPVYYSLNGGAPVGPVSTIGPIVQNGSENVTFTGPMAAVLTNGVNSFKFYTVLPGDEDHSNDTSAVSFTLNAISSFPYFESFSNPVGWTTSGTAMWFNLGGTGLVGPGGNPSDTGMYANFYNVQTGTGLLSAPIFNFSGLTNPILSFYVAYRSYAGEDDRLQVSVSTDGGATYDPAVYNKSRTSTPSLSTVGDTTGAFIPSVVTQWRHETINLSAYAGNSCVLISFAGTTAYGNICWIDDVNITNATNFSSQVVNATGPVVFSGLSDASSSYSLTANMTAIGPAGGNLNFERSVSVPTSTASLEFAANVTATAPNGAIIQPDRISPDGYYTLSYDYSSLATYDISINISAYGGIADADQLYIVKRADQNASWVALNTTRVGNVLTAAGITGFSQFGIAGQLAVNPLPVEMASFTANTSERKVNLSWTTTHETNNSGFDIERKPVNSTVWSKIGNVSGHGTSNTANTYSFADNNLQTGKYNYRLKQVDYNGNFNYFGLTNEVNVGVPNKFNLSQNYPNPFNPSTKINYDLPFDSKVGIKIFDMTGREVATFVNQVQAAGYYTFNFNASALSSGVYFYQITADGGSQNFVKTMKMVLVK